MTMPSSGSQISFTDFKTVFGFRNPEVFLGDYFGNSSQGYTIGVLGIPNSGNQLSFSTFAGKSRNLVTNSIFANGNTGWTNSAGWTTTFGENRPIILSDGNQPDNFKYFVRFSYIQNHTISQTITLSSFKSSYTFSFYARTSSFPNGSINGNVNDSVYGYARFLNASSSVIQTIGIQSYTSVTTNWTLFSYTTSGDMTNARSIQIILSGYDVGNWLGQYGSDITNVSLT